MARTIEINGRSGKSYKYWIFEIDYKFKPNQPGNYIFARETASRSWKTIYIGETSDLGEGFDNHEKMPCIRENGATHIHAHRNKKEQKRLAEAADLIEHWHPLCND